MEPLAPRHCGPLVLTSRLPGRAVQNAGRLTAKTKTSYRHGRQQVGRQALQHCLVGSRSVIFLGAAKFTALKNQDGSSQSMPDLHIKDPSALYYKSSILRIRRTADESPSSI